MMSMALCTEKNRVHTPLGHRDPHRRPLARIRRNLVVNDQDEVGTNRLIPQLNVLPVNKPIIDAREKNLGLNHHCPILLETRKSKTSRLQY